MRGKGTARDEGGRDEGKRNSLVEPAN